MSAATRALLFCTAALLEQGRAVDRLSRPLTAASLIALLLRWTMTSTPPGSLVACAWLVATAGIGEIYLAIRVDFDAALFRRLCDGENRSAVDGLDGALTHLGLLPAHKRGRPVEARVAGARRLFWWQMLAAGAQVLTVFAAGVLAVTRG
jgi:hypothetical protein